MTGRTVVRKERLLPIRGEVVVTKGAEVRAEDVVAHAELPGDVVTVNASNQLGSTPGELPGLMLKKPGEAVKQEEVIAQTRPLIKWFRSEVRSPVDGTVETVSEITGQVILRTAPKPVEVKAYVDGKVVEVLPGEGVVVETTAALVQGILGIGGEVTGELAMVGEGPGDVIEPGDLTEKHKGKIVVAGSMVTREVYDRANRMGVSALVSGGFHDADLRALLGYDLGVAITGHEAVSPTLIITEGFGKIAMAERTYKLLASHAGERVSANGATQIRAGVLRPEIIIPLGKEAEGGGGPESETASGLTTGVQVRIIREPGFGRLGMVKNLPPEPREVESGARVRVVEVEMPEGGMMIVPRTNVEVVG